MRLGQTLRDLYSHPSLRPMSKPITTTIMMKRRANSDSIPMDLIPEILSRLPAKSVARFRCVSKPWKSIICRQDFTKLFHTVSSSNPRLLIGVARGGDWRFFSSPQPQNHYGKSSLVVADFHTKFSGGYFSYASGLFYYTKVYEDDDVVRVICNPSTGQYAILPPDLSTTKRQRHSCGLLGFDPIGKQFKVLVFKGIGDDERVYHVLTLGTENMKWREIKCPSIYGPDSSGICINGVLYYYLAFGFVQEYDKIGCFDVRSEKFRFLHVAPDVGGCFEKLINYKGKLCGCNLNYGHYGGFPLKLCMWVLEDVEKGEWSTYAYTLSYENSVVKVHYDLSVVGVTALGEIVLAKRNASKPFYVFYFNPVSNTLLSVEIQSAREEEGYHSVYCFVDHVEDLNLDVMKTTYAAMSIRPPEQSTSTSSREYHQVRSVANLEQDPHTFESVNKFNAHRCQNMKPNCNLTRLKPKFWC